MDKLLEQGHNFQIAEKPLLALHYYKKAKKLDQNCPEILLAMTTALSALGRHKQALALIKTVKSEDRAILR
jgi:hypothetical protein